MNHSNGKPVTWAWLVSTILTMNALLFSVGAWAWSEHVEQPHSGAVLRDEYRHTMDSLHREIQFLHGRLERMEETLDRIEDKL